MEYLVDVGNVLLSLVLVGFLTETVIELLKKFVAREKLSEMIIYSVSIILGITLCLALQISIFTSDNPFAYYIGVIICGLVASRGSNYVHNWFDSFPRKESYK